MEQLIQTHIKDEKIYVKSPYNSVFVSKARNLQGTWNSPNWVFPAEIVEHVRNALLECYGVTGESAYETCVLQVSEFSETRRRSGIELFGRPIAKAFGRDSGAKLQEGIIMIDGKARSGGSVKNWTTVIEDASFEIHDFPVAALQREDVQEGVQEGWVIVKRDKAGPDLQLLKDQLNVFVQSVHKAEAVDTETAMRIIEASTEIMELLNETEPKTA